VRTHPILLFVCCLALASTKATAGACYADPARLKAAMATIVATYKCPGYERALFGKPLDVFIRQGSVLDQSTGSCERERALAMSAATERMLASRETFCAEVETALASDAALAQALVQAGARKAP
jgi:hypothetical protein